MHSMEPVIIPIHTNVPGRARFRLKPSARTPALRQWVDSEARSIRGVHRVKVSSVTGSVLVFFDPCLDWRFIAERIARVPAASVGDGTQQLQAAARTRPKAAEGQPAGATTQSVLVHPWHQLEAAHILKVLDTSAAHGLDPVYAEQWVLEHGSNVIHAARIRGRTEILKDQFMVLPMGLLLAESLIAIAGGAAIEAGLLLSTMMLNMTLGFLIDRRAERAIAALKHRAQPAAQVLRGGTWAEVPGETLAAGDIIKLKPGIYVGADCRILEASHLKIDESLLTGESNPVDKQVHAIQRRAIPLFAQSNMAFMGTLVVGGEGLAVVVATGSQTEYGKLSALFNETIPPQTPVIGKIDSLSAKLLKTALALSAGVFLVGLLYGRTLLQAIARSLSIAAAGIPAGLPSAATVNMALGVSRLKRKNISIRRLYSLESLSAVQIICFDKTGTLTRSRISVQQIFCSGNEIHVHQRAFWAFRTPFSLSENPDCRRLLQACVLCSESRIEVDPGRGQGHISGSPTEVALLHLALMAGHDPEVSYQGYPLKKVWHRSDIRRYMITAHAAPDGRTMVFVKGDPLEVLGLCAWQLNGGRREKLSIQTARAIENQNQRMAGQALRVLGFAFGQVDTPAVEPASLNDLTWIGLVGMAEPIREGVVSLIDQLHRAGIQTVMITGDQSTTAMAVASQIGLGDTTTIRLFDSSRFDALPPELASALIRDIQVFSRVNPAQKLQIIQAYQRRGMVVAMTGDGINDGPALRAADVGIAMGLSGTPAAREVADMVLERDNIASVKTAIMEGRQAYRNLKRSLRYFIATRFSDMLLATCASTIPSGAALLAFRPVQINLLTDLAPGLGLLMEPASPTIQREPPRDPAEPLFSNRDMLNLVSESAVLSGGGLAAFGYGLMRYGPGSRAATLAYESLTASKVLHALTCRPLPSDPRKTGSGMTNPLLTMAMAAALIAQAATILIPGLRRLLHIAPLSPADLAIVGLTALTTHSINHKIRERRKIEPKEPSITPAP